MNNWIRLFISALVSVMITVTAYYYPYTPLLYVLAPGFWLGDMLPVHAVNALGGPLFPLYGSAAIWTFLVFGVWWLRSGRADVKARLRQS